MPDKIIISILISFVIFISPFTWRGCDKLKECKTFEVKKKNWKTKCPLAVETASGEVVFIYKDPFRTSADVRGICESED